MYDAEELKAKATALQEMAPLLLYQAQRQFKRMHQILASLKCTGYVVQDERVKSLKKGYLEFQRARGVPSCWGGFTSLDGLVAISRHGFLFRVCGHSDCDAPRRGRARGRAVTALLEDSTTSEPRFAAAYCVLRSDQTLVYGSSEKEAKANPEGVVSLSIYASSWMRMRSKSRRHGLLARHSLRTFVVRAAHQVAPRSG